MKKIIFILWTFLCPLCFADSRGVSREVAALAKKNGLECRFKTEPKDCVVAYFDRNGMQPNEESDVVYFRVLHGQTPKGLAYVQDFYISGRKQTNPFVMRLDKSSLMSWLPINMGVEGGEIYWAETGEKKGQIFYKNGVRNGLFVEWYLNGQKRVETTYVNGKKHGAMRSYFENGNRKLVASFSNDVLNGFLYTWFEDGRIRSKIEYYRGIVMQ